MKVYYRITSIPSTNPSPIYADDKAKLNELCLKSFVEAFREVNPDVTFLCDFCPQEYKKMIGDIVPFKHETIFTTIGINETCLMQYELAKNQDDDILFQECDYIYTPNAGKHLVDGLQELCMVSPYDHFNFYLDHTLHSIHQTIKLVEDYHWRTTERNTMTFAIKNKVFKKNYDIFKYYGYLDADVWYDMLTKGQPLWTPIPSLATHMAKDWLAPSIQWKDIWETLI